MARVEAPTGSPAATEANEEGVELTLRSSTARPPCSALLPARWPWSTPAAAQLLVRIGCFNIRVDHDSDVGTPHEWHLRRSKAALAVRRLECDLLLLQEPGPRQAQELASDLGNEFCVMVRSCDPEAWSDPAQPPVGQRADGNGFIWKPERVELLGDMNTFWLSSDPAGPDGERWDGSPFRRTCTEARFQDRLTGRILHAFSAHFDHVGERARLESAKLVMRRAADAMAAQSRQDEQSAVVAPVVIVGGDFNTFPDCGGPETYAALATSAAEAGLVDVRAVGGVEVHDFGRGCASWEGFGHGPCRRAENEARFGDVAGQDASRFDHLFVPASADVLRTGVVEEAEWAVASDHLPIVAEIIVGSATSPSLRGTELSAASNPAHDRTFDRGQF
eukprot:TRINITY_DN63115_c0_g1_i1.p1 TRINITY_DN63115_c0_g1~~TRINITY_DN63115_c0_g1_i1.p1  ORF type:complete len:430 (-),score=67.77 TRINITY_DN63115_c0_g1_i1:13-1185(-)